MNSYSFLAGCYDRLTYDVDYAGWADYIEKHFCRRGLPGKTVLDLACGTGSLSCLLTQRGYNVIGTDLSEEMLTVAYEKALELEGERPMFVRQSMQKLRLPYTVDLTVCSLDSLNYLTNPEDCRETIRRVLQSLNPGGCFVFDINTPFKLKGLDGQVFLDEDEDQYCIWRASFEKEENVIYYGMDIFQRHGEHWLRSFEEHAEYAYSVQQLTDYLTEAGFTEISIYGDRRLSAPNEDELRIYFFAGKD